jgi:regulatory protein
VSKITEHQPEADGEFQRCFSAALSYLSYRPRGEAELRQRLTQRGFPKEAQNAVIGKLTEDGLVNDTIFAQFYKDARDYLRPRSKWLTKQELKQLGISSEIIEQVISTIDDDDNAYRAAMEKAKRLVNVDYETFSRKVGSHLQRRGFSSSVTKQALNKAWEDRKRPSEGTSQSCPH